MKIVKERYVLSLRYYVFESWCVFYTDSSYQFRRATLPVCRRPFGQCHLDLQNEKVKLNNM